MESGIAQIDYNEARDYNPRPVIKQLAILPLFLLVSCSGLTWPWASQEEPIREPKASLRLKSGTIKPSDVPGVRTLPPPPLPINDEVKAQLKFFSGSNRRFITESLERRERYYEPMQSAFSQQGLHLDLLNVALIESGFDPSAKSPSGAKGIWQFMKVTARSYGLQVGLLRDDRKDPNKSSIAAARHLRELYEAFGDWHLALAAYNAGRPTVERAIKSAGTSDFWELARRKKLKRETVCFVAKYIATTLILQSPAQYGLEELAA